MDPELIRVIDTVMREEETRVNAQYGKWNVEQVGEPVLHCRLAQRRCCIVILTTMVHLMGAPSNVQLVHATMRPIIAKVHCQRGQAPVPPGMIRHVEHAHVLIERVVKDHRMCDAE